ncbi:hypothetical protein, partial [Anaerosolibacter sp.]|uniref:hypothetical protein n=1 Tax=Anaerosolibacter sp. TaxID=1872527 RepID=UPI0039F0AB95
LYTEQEIDDCINEYYGCYEDDKNDDDKSTIKQEISELASHEHSIDVDTSPNTLTPTVIDVSLSHEPEKQEINNKYVSHESISSNENDGEINEIKTQGTLELSNSQDRNTSSNCENGEENKDNYIEVKDTQSSTNNTHHTDTIINFIKDISASIDELKVSFKNLNSRIDEIDHRLNEIRLDAPYEKVREFADELIEIYANEGNKKNVNINPAINRKVLDMMHKKYNISKNNSLAINTALLMSLYQNNTKLQTNHEIKKIRD